MAKNRIPAKKAEVTGAAIKNPGRFKDRKEPSGTRALGEPYKTMNEAQIECWREFASELPWLNSSHRVLVHMACILTARLCSGENFGIQAAQTLSAILSKLGATPVDSSKVNYAGNDEVDPADEFFNGYH